LFINEIYICSQLRLQGKTHDAKRLKLIREEREAAQAKREAEAEGIHPQFSPSI